MAAIFFITIESYNSAAIRSIGNWKNGSCFFPSSLSMIRTQRLIFPHGLLEKFARAGKGVIPRLQQRRPPLRIVEPGRPTDAFAFNVIDDERGVVVVLGRGPLRHGK